MSSAAAGPSERIAAAKPLRHGQRFDPRDVLGVFMRQDRAIVPGVGRG
jgi:hypothetical protein